MADFRKQLIAFTGALFCSGIAFGQGPVTCAAPVAIATNLIRAEGTTEQIAPVTFVCTSAAAGAGVNGPLSLSVFLNPALPITSKVTSTTTGATEALATLV